MNPLCHLQMPTKALSCKKEAICEQSPEVPSCPEGKGSFKMDCFFVYFYIFYFKIFVMTYKTTYLQYVYNMFTYTIEYNAKKIKKTRDGMG